MNGYHLNFHSRIYYQLKSKSFWLIAIALLAIIFIPSGIVFASEVNVGNTDNPNADISLSGKVSVWEGTFQGENPEVHVIGWKEDGSYFKTPPVYVNDDGTYIIESIPSTVNGLIVAKYYQAETGFKVLPHETTSEINFHLERGARGPFGTSEYLNHYVIKAGSTFTDSDGITLTLNNDLNLPADYQLNIGFADKSLLVPDHYNSTLTYKFENVMGNMNMIISAWGKNGKEFANFIIKDRIRIFQYVVHSSNTVVPVDPVFTKVGTMVITGNFRDDSTGSEEILSHDPYVYAVWYDFWKEEFGWKYGEVADEFSNEGAYGFSDIPTTAIGVVAGGASGYAMDFNLFMYGEYQRSDLSVPHGAKFTILPNQLLNNVVLAAGTEIKFSDEEEIYKLPKDVDLGNEFPPFGLLLDTNITFNTDGTVSYVYEASPEHHVVDYAKFIFKIVPKEGYVFNKWLLNGVETAGNYTVNSRDDVVLEPVIIAPAPDPEIANGNIAQTGDDLNAIIPALFVLASLSAIALINKKRHQS